MPKRLISEQYILNAAKKGERKVFYDDDTIVTAAAKDRAIQLNVKIEMKQQAKDLGSPAALQVVASSIQKDIIAIGSDHGGFSLKETLKLYLKEKGYTVIDLGTNSEESCDYPDFAYAVAKMVSSGGAVKGIMIDSVGIASSIVANKIKGIRAVCCCDEFAARSSREHNDANILTLGGKLLGAELAKSIVKVWMETSYTGGRHQKRIEKISDIEHRSFK